MKISNQNLEKIQKIKDVIEAEEGVHVSDEEALTRVLTFYKRYVPYN